MNIYQVLNHRATVKRQTLNKKLGLIGLKEKHIVSNRRSSIKLSRPSIICSDHGAGIELQQNESAFLLSLIRKTVNPYLSIHKNYVISASNHYKNYFNTLMILLTVYSVISSLYFLAFNKVNLAANIIDDIIWGLFIIDFILNFFSEFRDVKKRKISNLRLIFDKYAKGMMIPDLLALIPLRFAGHPNGEYILRLLRTLKIGRVFGLVNIYYLADALSGIVYKEECLSKKRIKIKIFLFWEIIKQVVKMFFATYFLACVWYYYIDYLLREKHESNDFIKNFQLEAEDSGKKFIKTWYFIFSTLVTVGYGDFYATNKYEMGFAVILVLAGPTWFAFMMGISINIINSLQDLSGKSQNKSDLQLWLSSIELNSEPLPSTIKGKVLLHFTNLWKNDRLGPIFNGSSSEYFNISQTQDAYFSQLPESIKVDLLKYIFSDKIYKFQVFFKSFCPVQYEICRFLQPRIFSPQEKIQKINKPVQEIIFKDDGIVEASIVRKNEVLSQVQISKKCIIGEYFVIRNINSGFQYLALTYVKGFSIESFVLKEFCKDFKACAEDYVDKVENFYSQLEEFLMESAKKKALDTKEAGDDQLINEEKTGRVNVVSLSQVLRIQPNECKLNKEIEKVNKIVKNFNENRKKLLSELKEKITNLAVIHMTNAE